MKISNLIIATIIVFGTACDSGGSESGHSHEHGPGNNEHSQGTESHEHDHGEEGHHEQEEFSVDGDTTSQENEPGHHTHDNGTEQHDH